MYQSFTGSSRRPRHVDLSGKKPNPWASVSQPGPQQALQSAQHDRQIRQRQREELAAAKTIQRVWRGHTFRIRNRQDWREQWDSAYSTSDRTQYLNQDEALSCLQLLVSFAQPSENSDVRRVIWAGEALGKSEGAQNNDLYQQWLRIHKKLARFCLRALARLVVHDDPSAPTLLGLLDCAILSISTDSRAAIGVAGDLFETISFAYKNCAFIRPKLLDLTTTALSGSDDSVYAALIATALRRPQDADLLKSLAKLIDRPRFLTVAVTGATDAALEPRQALWLLGNMIYLMGSESSSSGFSLQLSDDHSSGKFIQLVSTLLGIVAETLDVESPALMVDNYHFDRELYLTGPAKTRLNRFLRQALQSLVDQNTIRRVVNEFQASDNDASTDLATYVLTLLRLFYQHADDIRMWLYLGPLNQPPGKEGVSPISFFWKAARASVVVRSIVENPRAAVSLITSRSPISAYQAPRSVAGTATAVLNDWKVVLIFLELYTFVLKLMDDEEFLGQNTKNGRVRTNPLSVADVAELVVFLKHLGFAMYYYSEQISAAANTRSESLSKRNLNRAFGIVQSTPEPEHLDEYQPVTVAGLSGISLEYVKGIVTGLVRAIYERDSRRRFLPKGQWLMTSEFDMSNFISNVVAEEESRHQIQDMDEEEAVDSDNEVDSSVIDAMNSNLRRMRETEKRQRALKRASRKRYLESIAPRLEILQHLPFLIPFDTRVEISRAFVRLDQTKRRNGYLEPDLWRHSVATSRTRNDAEREIGQRHARIRRQHEFRDSMKQFFHLGAALKEPIWISFIDEFGLEEAGIDGGGVTKEFLTSATANAFSLEYGLFSSTSQHLLYPNPTALEVLRNNADDSDVDMDDEVFQDPVRKLLNKYEYAGRLIGKCLYEGILVDISFAGFFLNKWATAGSSSSHSQGSAYRANINDLRDLDEDLYQGLLSLKNFQGDAQELALSFSITDEIPQDNKASATVERDLVPNGSNISVTNENKLVYISRIAQYRLHVQSYRQSNAFLKGLSSIIQPSWLAMFNQSELQNLVGGAASAIDIEDLRRNTIYGGVYVIGDDGQEHPCVDLFWRVMHELGDEDKGKVLKFVTSTPRAPLLGFGSLVPKFSIRDNGTDEGRFPTSSTCINLLKLPRYTSKAILRDRLISAINSGAGFDLS